MRLLGQGTGLIGLVDSRRPKTVIKIPKKESGWTQSLAEEKVRMLDRVPGYETAIVKTDFVEEIDVIWYRGRWDQLRGDSQKYRGWAFVQSRVQKILPKIPDVGKVAVAEFVNIHYHLWQYGVALRSPNELYGFFNKGYDQSGQLVGFDIGSLTSNASEIRERFLNGTYERKYKSLIQELKQVNQAELVEEYFSHIHRMINLETFESQWEKRRAKSE